MSWPNQFCWSKVGPEAGLNLDQILRWKEFQRSLSGGQFFWGVGGIPSRPNQDAFIQINRTPRVLFCEQLGKARKDYLLPPTVVLWTHYLNQDGREVALPRYAAVTSKGGASRHFAIVCNLESPLRIVDNINFDIGLFGNFRGSANIAFQQPAPIIEANKNGCPRMLYKRGFWADLSPPYFVTLTRCRELVEREKSKICEMMSSGSVDMDQFKTLIEQIKSIR